MEKKDEPKAGGVELLPFPGQNDTAVTIRSKDSFMEEVDTVEAFALSHAFTEDVQKLLLDAEDTEEQIKKLKVRIVEKNNFLESVGKREQLLKDDVKADEDFIKTLDRFVEFTTIMCYLYTSFTHQIQSLQSSEGDQCPCGSNQEGKASSFADIPVQ